MTMKLLQIRRIEDCDVLKNQAYLEYLIDAMIRDLALEAVGHGWDFLTHTLKYKREPNLDVPGYDTVSMSAWCE